MISDRDENIEVMNTFSKLRAFDESSRVGNIVHVASCSLSSMRLSCRMQVKVVGKENCDVGVGLANTGSNQKRLETGNQE